ncbi:MAG TPA: type II secretion system protein [Candidatus Saccharimonadales bacterium]|nr:type II secretion system protein [Candidatus Saccharimonadales bacterium]
MNATSLKKNQSSLQGFTLIELLVVIAIISVLAVGLLAAINPLDKINSAADARVQNDLGVLARASESYSSSHSGFYPAAIADLVSSSELKVAPVPPTGYAYTFTALPGACTAGSTCTSITITAPLKSSKYSANPFQRYESATGKSCQVLDPATACP